MSYPHEHVPDTTSEWRIHIDPYAFVDNLVQIYVFLICAYLASPSSNILFVIVMILYSIADGLSWALLAHAASLSGLADLTNDSMT